MRNYLGVISVTILSGSMLACSSDDSSSSATEEVILDAATLSDTVEMDKNYVPSLFYSNLSQANSGLTQDAANTLNGLASNWSDYKTSYDSYLDWNAYFGDIDANLTTASGIYSAISTYPADLTPAHLELESVRDSWSDMRSQNGISYFFDKVTAAHHTMEGVGGASGAYNAVASKTADDVLTLQNALIASVPTFKTDWDALNTMYGDGSTVNALYNLSLDKGAALAKNISNADSAAPGMTQMLGQLDSAMTSCDTTSYDPADYNPEGTGACDKMIFISSKIKPKFVPVFLALGDFITPFMTDIIATNKAIIPALYCTGNPPDAAATCADGSGDTRQGTLDYLNSYAAAMATFGAHLPVSSSMNLPGALGWGPSMGSAQMALQTAIATMTAATDLAEAKTNGAHDNIETIRTAMHYICADYENHVTIMTSLNNYHTEFEKVLAIAMNADGTPKTSLTELELADINDLMAELQSAFLIMTDQVVELDYAAWGLVGGDLDDTVTSQNTNLSELVTALAAYDASTNDNSAEIVGFAVNLKKKYVPFFKKLGTF